MCAWKLRTSLALLLGCWTGASWALVVPLPAARPAVALKDISLPRVSDGKEVNLGAALSATTGRTLLVLGTHPADFNCIEYAQKVRAAWPQLRDKGVDRCMMIMNGKPESCSLLAELLDLPVEIELFSDSTGEAGRQFCVSRGFRPDDDTLNPSLKLFAMGIGIGPPWMTLPAVLTGYVGELSSDGDRPLVADGGMHSGHALRRMGS